MTSTATTIGELSHILGDVRAKIVELDVTSYSAGGESMTAAMAGLTRLDLVIPVVVEGAAELRCAVWDRTNAKIILAETGAALSGVFSELEAAATTKIVVLAIGK